MRRCDPRLLLATAVLTALAGCARSNQESASAAADMAMEAPSAEAEAAPMPAAAREPEAVQTPGVDPGQLASSAAAVATDDPKRRFVRTADATFQVQDVYASILAIEDAVAAERGFVVRNGVSAQPVREIERPIGDGKRLRLSEVATTGTMVVRVPSERTQTFLRTIARQMQFLDARSFEANDVQFDLLRKQLAYARAQELQRDIRSAGAQPAETGEKLDAVQAREAMLAARDEAVVAERELDDRIAFSTLTLALRQPAQVREQVVPDTEAIIRARGPGFFSEIGEALRAGWRGLLAALVLIVHLWPLWLLIGAVWWALIRFRRVRNAARKPVQDAPAAATNDTDG